MGRVNPSHTIAITSMSRVNPVIHSKCSLIGQISSSQKHKVTDSIKPGPMGWYDSVQMVHTDLLPPTPHPHLFPAEIPDQIWLDGRGHDTEPDQLSAALFHQTGRVSEVRRNDCHRSVSLHSEVVCHFHITACRSWYMYLYNTIQYNTVYSVPPYHGLCGDHVK